MSWPITNNVTVSRDATPLESYRASLLDFPDVDYPHTEESARAEDLADTLRGQRGVLRIDGDVPDGLHLLLAAAGTLRLQAETQGGTLTLRVRVDGAAEEQADGERVTRVPFAVSDGDDAARWVSG